jgi:cholest-4-en-3-one 26-monooxygenase
LPALGASACLCGADAPGIGEHFFMGSHLVWPELKVIFEGIPKLIRNPRRKGDVNWLRSTFTHGIQKMPIAFDVVSPV